MNSMIVTLSGENAFCLKQELGGLVKQFVEKYGDLSLEHLDGEDADFAGIQAGFTSLPFFSDKKMVVLREASKNKEFTEAIEQLLKDVPESTDIIFIEPKLDKRLSFYKLLKNHTDFREFKELDQNILAHWLIDTAKNQDGYISNSDAIYLVDRVGANQLMLSNELAKLLLYDSKITRQSINLLTDQTPQSTIFQLLDAAFNSNRKRVLELYNEQRELKVEPPNIIAMLTWQLNILAILKTAGDKSIEQIAKEAKLNPYVLNKNQSFARKLSLQNVKKMINDLLIIDVTSKSKSIDLDEALKHYLLTL
jgi:DNA polymerase-3 subunit delta